MPDIGANHDGRVTYAELDEAIIDNPVQTTVERYELVGNNTVRLDLVCRFEHALTRVDVTSTLDGITQPDHRHLMSVTLDGVLREAVLPTPRPFGRASTTRLRLRT